MWGQVTVRTLIGPKYYIHKTRCRLQIVEVRASKFQNLSTMIEKLFPFTTQCHCYQLPLGDRQLGIIVLKLYLCMLKTNSFIMR